MYCRRCFSRHLLRLEKKLPQDNEVLRCQECGFLFSPSVPQQPGRSASPESGQGESAEPNPSDTSPVTMAGIGPPGTLVEPGE